MAYSNRFLPIPDVRFGSNSDTHSDSNANTHSDTNTYADTYSYSNTDSDAGAERSE